MLTHPSNAASTDPNASLGGIRTSTAIVTDTSQNLFDNVSGAESRDGRTEYRCIFVYNSNSSSTLTNARIWISQNTIAADDEVDMALNPNVGVGSNTTEFVIGTETTTPNPTPTTMVFSHPLSGTPLTIGDIPPLNQKGVWFRRVVNAGGGAQSNNTFAWAVEGESS